MESPEMRESAPPSRRVQRARNLASAHARGMHRRAMRRLSSSPRSSLVAGCATAPEQPGRSAAPVAAADRRTSRGDLLGLTAQRAGRPFRQPRAPGPRGRRASSSSSARRAACSTPISIRRPAAAASRVTYVDTRAAVRRRRPIRRPASPRSKARELIQRPARRFGDHRVGIAEMRLALTATSAGSPLLPAAIRQLRTIRLRPIRLIGEPANISRNAGIVERQQVGEPRRGQLGARQERPVGRGGVGEAVPRAHRQAIVAAVDAVADRLAEFLAGSARHARS